MSRTKNARAASYGCHPEHPFESAVWLILQRKEVVDCTDLVCEVTQNVGLTSGGPLTTAYYRVAADTMHFMFIQGKLTQVTPWTNPNRHWMGGEAFKANPSWHT